MQSFNIEEVIGVFEAVSDQEERITDLKAQMKMISADNAKRFEEFAKEKETKPANIKALYKHWKENKDKDAASEENEDLYTLMAMMDMYLDKQNSEDTEVNT